MKAVHSLVSLLALSLAGSAFAGGGPYPEPAVPTVESTKSRAEVMAEAAEANRLGLLTIGEEDLHFASVASTRSRAEVAAEAAEASRLGLLSFGEGDVPVATAEQEAMIIAAGRRASELTKIAAGTKAEEKK